MGNITILGTQPSMRSTFVKKLKKLTFRFESNRKYSKYTAFIKVAGIKIPKYIKRHFRRAALGEISHDDLRAEFISSMGLESDRL